MTTTTQQGDPGPTAFTLFGATGDLAKRLVLPSFYRLWQEKLLPEQWVLVGSGRGDVAHEDFRGDFHRALAEFDSAPDPKEWEAFSQRLFFAGGGFNIGSRRICHVEPRGAQTGLCPGCPLAHRRRPGLQPRRARAAGRGQY